MNTSMDSLSIEIESVAKDSNTAVDLLINKLDKLRTSLQNVIKESENFSKLKNNIETVSRDAVSKATSKASSKSGSDYGTYHEQLYQLGVGDLGDSSYAKLKSTVATTNSEIKKFVTTNNEVVTVSKSTKNGLENVRVSVKTLGDESKKTASSWGDLAKGFAAGFAKITATYAILSRLASKLGGFVTEAANYEESMNLFMVTLGDRAEEAGAWVDKFSNALYLDPAGVRQYMGSFNSLTKGLGVGADSAYIMSKNLTQLTYDLASFKNLSFDTAFRKLQSAMSGEIEPLRNVGVALSQATLQELALSMGIEKNVADMSEAEKAQLRYIQILKSTSEWQTDMGATLVTPANALRIVKQQFTLLARAIGQVFIPILMNVIPYVMVLTQALTKLAQKIAGLLGYKIQDVNYDRISGGLSGISDGITDIGDSAGKTTKKLNTMLAPFDELNVVQNQLDKSGGGSGTNGLGGGLDLPLPGYDALANLNDQLTKKMDEAKQKLKDMLPIIAAIGGAFAAWKIGKKVADFISWYDKLPGAGKAAARIGLSIGLVFLGFAASKKGDKDVLNEKTLLKGVGEQIAGSTGYGLAAGLLTKNVTVGLFVGLSFLGFRGSKTASTGDWKNGLTGFFEQGLSVAGIAGLAFKMSGGNPEITLGVTALVVWANVLFDLGELAAMKPTLEELGDAFKILGGDVLDFVNQHPGLKAMVDGMLGLNPITKIAKDVAREIANVKVVTEKLSDAWEQAKKDLPEKWEEIKTSVSKKWDDMKTKASNTWDGIKTSVSNKWNEIKTNTSTKWDEIKKDFSSKVDNMKNTASENFESIKTSITNKWASAKTWLSNNIGSTSYWKNKFNGILDGASNVLNALRNKFANWSATLRLPHISWVSNGISTSGTLRKILQTLNLPTTLPKLSVSWYAEGGFPKDGEFFVANENGPEMIGKIGNRSAVANNDQIETSLTNALITALNNYDFGGGNSPTTIYIGNKKVYEGYGDYINGENDRYGTNTIRI